MEREPKPIRLVLITQINIYIKKDKITSLANPTAWGKRVLLEWPVQLSAVEEGVLI